MNGTKRTMKVWTEGSGAADIDAHLPGDAAATAMVAWFRGKSRRATITVEDRGAISQFVASMDIR